jgi:ZIP family zinc transporter
VVFDIAVRLRCDSRAGKKNDGTVIQNSHPSPSPAALTAGSGGNVHAILVLGVAFGTFCATLAGGALALRLSDRLHLLIGFSAGAVVAVSFFDLLPEALKLSGQGPFSVLSTAAFGFFAYTILDRAILLHTHEGGHGHGAPNIARGWAGAASLSGHSLMDGLAIGLAFQDSRSVGIAVAIAVLAHDCSDGMNTVSLILKNAGSRGQAVRWLLLDAAAPVMGAAASLLIHLPQEALAEVLALFGGFFLYIGASDLLPESFHAHPKVFTTITTLSGAALLYVVVRLSG